MNPYLSYTLCITEYLLFYTYVQDWILLVSLDPLYEDLYTLPLELPG